MTTGLLSNGTAGAAVIFSSNNLITGNGTGLSSVGGGNLLTYKNNSTDGNLAAGAFTGPDCSGIKAVSGCQTPPLHNHNVICCSALSALTSTVEGEGPMLRNKLLLIGLAAASLAFAVQPASAQATRTWVSGVGDDANPCSRTAPCKTFAGAISKTAAGGEISVLDPGGFGAVTITKSITIDGGGGQVTSTLVSGTNGIVVSAPATATVTLRNIRINGLVGTPSGGLNGIQFLSGGALHVEHCTIFGFTQNAININLNSPTAVNVFVTDTVVSNSAGGLDRQERRRRKPVCIGATDDVRSKHRLRAESRWRRRSGIAHRHRV